MTPSGFEIERRFLVRVPPGRLEALEGGVPLMQGYIAHRNPSVRIRVGEARGAVLTCKSGKGIKRREVETTVPSAVAEALMKAAGKRVIRKVRYPLGPWVLDRFEGLLTGLFLLEVELEAVDAPLPPPPTGIVMLREVTEDKRFTSGHLARLKKKDRVAFVPMVYAEVEG
ncbi:MAG: adenylate cyclase [Gemmatimonadota bacterium]